MDSFKIGGVFDVRCFDNEGFLKWKTKAYNMVVDQGIQHILDLVFTGAATQNTTWYVGLMQESPAMASTDRASAHAGFTMVYPFGGDNPAWVEVRSGNALSNSASKASYSITSSSTVGGAYLISYATVTATIGFLMSGASFTAGNQSVENGDTLTVQYDLSAADA